MYSFKDHRIEEFLDADWDNIAKLPFKDFMVKFRAAFLPTGWEGQLEGTILSMRQGDMLFWEWYNSMMVKNMLLRGTSAHLDLPKICKQLAANMTDSLKSRCRYEGADTIVEFEKWIEDVRQIDDYQNENCVKRERENAQRRGSSTANSCTALGEPSRNAHTVLTTTATTATTVRTEFKPKPLSTSECELLRDNGGCYKCWKPFVYHMLGDCNNSFPTSNFSVDKAYVDSFKKKESKPKPVTVVFDRSHGRERANIGRLSGDHHDR